MYKHYSIYIICNIYVLTVRPGGPDGPRLPGAPTGPLSPGLPPIPGGPIFP